LQPFPPTRRIPESFPNRKASLEISGRRDLVPAVDPANPGLGERRELDGQSQPPLGLAQIDALSGRPLDFCPPFSFQKRGWASWRRPPPTSLRSPLAARFFLAMSAVLLTPLPLASSHLSFCEPMPAGILLFLITAASTSITAIFPPGRNVSLSM